MAGVVLETLSWKKLTILGVTLLVLLITFFLIGGKIAPAPSNVIVVQGTNCVNKGGQANIKEWFIPRGGNEKCEKVESLEDKVVQDKGISANQIVFSFWLPHPRDFQQLDFSRWQQNLLGILLLEIQYDQKIELEDNAKITLDVQIGYRQKDEDVNDWKPLASSLEDRQMVCRIDEDQKKDGYNYDCDVMQLFEIGSVHHDYYLVNIRVPVEPYKGVNMGIGKLTGLTLVAIHQNGGFTKVWFSLKTALFPMVLIVLIWFWRRIRMLTRPPNLLERTLFALGITMTMLNLPLEWLTLAFDMPWMLLLTDIRQGVFYAMMLSFWIIFTGEHIMDQAERNRLMLYWKHLLAIIIGCFCLLIFELCERGMQLANPFFSIWVTGIGTKLAYAFIIVAGIAACCYFLFLCYMIVLVFRNISTKKSTLPNMSSGRRSYYMGLIYRFKFLMLATLVCAALTVVFFILSQLNEGSWKWSDDGVSMEYTSAFFTGVYGMWNVYIFGLLSLYAPSHKQFSSGGTTEDSHEEEVQLTGLPSSVIEGSTLQAFVAKAAAD